MRILLQRLDIFSSRMLLEGRYLSFIALHINVILRSNTYPECSFHLIKHVWDMLESPVTAMLGCVNAFSCNAPPISSKLRLGASVLTWAPASKTTLLLHSSTWLVAAAMNKHLVKAYHTNYNALKNSCKQHQWIALKNIVVMSFWRGRIGGSIIFLKLFLIYAAFW